MKKSNTRWKKKHPYFRYILGDVRDKDAIFNACKNVDFIFHAAALKHVPACENNPYEAVKTNITGSYNICQAAIYNNVKKLVALSTDKAVKPINAMGISKSMMEKIIINHNKNNSDTKFSVVRYGNVMGSRGSVIPLFVKLLKRGERLPVTVADMTRFMMTLDDSVNLVLHAITHTKGGEIFVKKAPAVTIIDLAKAMIKKYGDGDISKIDIVGIRSGEKLHETLVNEYEIIRANENDDFYEILPEYENHSISSKYEQGYEYSSNNTTQLTSYNEISKLLDMMGNVELYI